MKVLEIKNINKSFNERKVLSNFSLNIEEGEIVSIIGPSGVGKSTLLRCINGLEKIDSGEILINNKSLKRKKDKISKEANLEVGLVFQDYNLFPQYSVIKNITLPLTTVLKIEKEEATKQAEELLKKMNLLEKRYSYPYELSGGERQRVAIARAVARALCMDPEVLLFDEPTSALDPKLVMQVSKTIKDLANIGKAIIIVTHDISFAEQISDRIIEVKLEFVK